MKWEQYIPYIDHNNLGSLVSVYLNSEKTLIKRTYDGSGVTVNGKETRMSKEKTETCWKRESYWLEELKDMSWTPELVEVNYDKKYTIQRYYGPDLLDQGFDKVVDIESQVLDIYKFFKEINVYKLNGSLSNMTRNESQLIIFDFKYMRTRSEELREFEEYSIDTWLSKINSNLVPKLKAML